MEKDGKDVEFDREHIVLASCDLESLGAALLEIPEGERPGIYFEEERTVADALLESDEEDEEDQQKTMHHNIATLQEGASGGSHCSESNATSGTEIARTPTP